MEEVNHLEVVTEAAVTAAEETVGKFTHQFFDIFKKLLTWENLFKFIGAIFVILCILIIFKLIKRAIKRISPEKLLPQHNQLITKIITYLSFAIIIMYVLSLFGIKLSAIWGAAGIAGIAIGFAAQTSVSNLISGLFVLSERVIKIGDFITVDGESGTVDSVGLLSVKIHTSDNQMIRIPNSTIINSALKNNNFFENRRMTFQISIDYNSDMNKALEVLKTVPALCPTVLQNPEPKVWYDGFGDSGINMTLAVWFLPANLIQTKNEVFIAMKKVFANADEFEQIFDFKQSENKSIKISDVYLAKKDGKVIGGVAQVAGPTYDKGKLIVGVKLDGEISGVEILELSDSPGFGLKANDPTFILPNGKTFYGQFSGLNAKEPFVSGKNYDAISGATITSDAIINLIKAGSDSLLDYMESKYE